MAIIAENNSRGTVIQLESMLTVRQKHESLQALEPFAGGPTQNRVAVRDSLDITSRPPAATDRLSGHTVSQHLV